MILAHIRSHFVHEGCTYIRSYFIHDVVNKVRRGPGPCDFLAVLALEHGLADAQSAFRRFGFEFFSPGDVLFETAPFSSTRTQPSVWSCAKGRRAISRKMRRKDLRNEISEGWFRFASGTPRPWRTRGDERWMELASGAEFAKDEVKLAKRMVETSGGSKVIRT